MNALKKFVNWFKWTEPHSLAWHVVNVLLGLALGLAGLWVVVDYILAVRENRPVMPSFANVYVGLAQAAFCFYWTYRQIKWVWGQWKKS